MRALLLLALVGCAAAPPPASVRYACPIQMPPVAQDDTLLSAADVKALLEYAWATWSTCTELGVNATAIPPWALDESVK